MASSESMPNDPLVIYNPACLQKTNNSEAYSAVHFEAAGFSVSHTIPMVFRQYNLMQWLDENVKV